MTHAATGTGEHRRRRPLVAAVAVIVVAAVIAASVWWTRDDGDPAAAPAASSSQQQTPPTRQPTSSAAPTPARTSTLAAKPKPKPKPKPKIPHEYVAAAAPTSFSIAGPKFAINARVCGMDNVRPLDPPGEQHHTVCWVQEGFGVAPGSRSATTYVLGHAWAQDSQEVLNKLSEPATREILRGKTRTVSGVTTYPVASLNGYLITLRTPSGVLRYRVSNAYGVAKSQAASVAPLMDESVKKRVVIITCAELNGTDYDYNVIVEAHLTASIANPT